MGSGLGQLARAMARAAAPGGSVIGIERDTQQLAEARRQADELVEFRRGEATAFPLRDDEWGSFDLAHSRFLLEHVADPQRVVSAMARAVRPGGRIILEDDDHDVLRLWPEPEGIYRLWRAYIDVYHGRGNDPFVGRHLVAMLREAGAEPVRNNWLFFGSCSGHPAFPAFVDNFVGVLGGAREAILELTNVRAAEFERAIEAFKQWGERSDAALWYATSWAEGHRPDST
ncbi:MAG: methyltransferase domain-containing protein [Candidatus Krumholzibacteriia bacterium]